MAIELDGPKLWQDDFKKELRKVEGNKVGELILQWIKANPHTLWVIPTDGKHGEKGDGCDAITKARGGWEGQDNVAPAGQPYHLGRRNDMIVDQRHHKTDGQRHGKEVTPRRTGTGQGNDVALHYSAENHRVKSCTKGFYASQADDVLFHELVHALRMMGGVFDQVPTRDYLYKNEEEWLAVVITNVFISEKGGTEFRASFHVDGSRLDPPLNTPGGFLDVPENLSLVLKFFLHWPRVSWGLNGISSAPFNPFHEFATVNPVKYQLTLRSRGEI